MNDINSLYASVFASWFSTTSTLAILLSTITLFIPTQRLYRIKRTFYRLLSNYTDDYVYREVDEFIDGLESNILFDDILLHIQSQLQSISYHSDGLSNPYSNHRTINKCALIRSQNQLSIYTPRLRNNEYMELY